MYHKVLIPLDNSPTDATILEHVRLLARHTGAELVLVHVADGFGARLQEQLDLADSEEIRKDRNYLEETTRQLKAEGFTVHYHLLKGDPVACLAVLADEEKCDLVAMATHGHQFLSDWCLGSVADGLRHKISIPILMIKAKK